MHPAIQIHGSRLRRTALCLAIAVVGGAVFHLLGVPLPWLLGAMLTTTAATLAGVELAVERRLRDAMLVVIGVLIGSAFDTELLAAFDRWFWSLAALPLYVVVIAGIVMLYFRRAAGFDPVTAYFSAAPGGLSEMILLSERHGGDVRRTSLVHTLRVLLLVTAIPFVVDQLGLLVPDAEVVREAPSLGETLFLLATGVVGVVAGRLVRLPSAVILGPMLASALVHIVGWSETHPPDALVALAQVVIGASVGARFSGLRLGEFMAILGHGAVVTALMIVLSAIFAVAIHPLAGMALLPLLIAYVPGGVAEMALVALALGIDPAFVTTHHVVRILLVVSLAGVMIRLVAGPRSPPSS